MPFLDLMPQEALHWNRAMHIAPAFVDHPGGVAVIIKSATLVFGNSEFAVRIGALLCGLLSTFFVYKIGTEISGNGAVLQLRMLFLNYSYFSLLESNYYYCRTLTEMRLTTCPL